MARQGVSRAEDLPVEMLAEELAANLQAADLPTRLELVRLSIAGRLVFTTSFGLEDQALLHAICASGLTVEIVTLDTGRLFPETYDLWAETEERYGRRILGFSPDQNSLEALVAGQGINGFRHSIESRHACCRVRKVEPLGRALAGASGWLTGLRSAQSGNRALTPLAQYDPAFGLLKVNPLADWSQSDLTAYVAENAVPYNRLHDRGFASIGCAPCTRAVQPGEPERAGRWWWENDTKKECGLHLRPVPAAPSPQIEDVGR